MHVKINIDFFKKLPAREKKITISTLFTLLRVFLTPFLVLFMVKGWWGFALWCFFIAALTDTCDGSLARWRNEQTLLGACLDPVADKIVIVASFFTLACINNPVFVVPRWFAFLVFIKEVALLTGVICLYMRYGYIKIEPTRFSKMSTAIQMCFIGWLFACYFFDWMPLKTYVVMLGVVMVMVLGSLVQYAYIGMLLRKNK